VTDPLPSPHSHEQRLRPWSDKARRALLPAIIAACYAGDRDRVADLCHTEEPDPGQTGPVMTDPTDRRH